MSRFAMTYDEELDRGLADGSLCPKELATGDPCGRPVHLQGLCEAHAAEAGLCHLGPRCANGCGRNVRCDGVTCWTCRSKAERKCQKCGEPTLRKAPLCYRCSKLTSTARSPEARDRAQRAARARWLAAQSVTRGHLTEL